MDKNEVTPVKKVVLIGGSAGSLEVLLQLVPKLRKKIPFALVIILHRKYTDDNMLEELLAMKTAIPLQEVEDKAPLREGFLHIAPADYHLLFENNGLLSLDTSEKINYSRPSIDVSFESAAEVYQDGVTAILLSGANADGTNGLKTVQQNGGTAIIQDPETAEMPYMPQNALENMTPDYVMDINGITQFLANM